MMSSSQGCGSGENNGNREEKSQSQQETLCDEGKEGCRVERERATQEIWKDRAGLYDPWVQFHAGKSNYPLTQIGNSLSLLERLRLWSEEVAQR